MKKGNNPRENSGNEREKRHKGDKQNTQLEK